jgi:TatA/E family protein of Tat protein translocase
MGSEWIIIIFVVLIVLLGTNKLPDVAKKFGKAVGEYNKTKNDVILDPFLGSGQVAVISKMLGRKFLGYEIVKEYYKFAKKRLDRNVYRLKEKNKRKLKMKH